MHRRLPILAGSRLLWNWVIKSQPQPQTTRSQPSANTARGTAAFGLRACERSSLERSVILREDYRLSVSACSPSPQWVSSAGMTEVTRILSAMESGDPLAAEQLLPLVYDELRRLAAQKMA